MEYTHAYVSVSRRWKDHTINHTVVFNQDGVSISANLDEALVAIAKEVGPVYVPVKRWFGRWGTKYVPIDLENDIIGHGITIVDDMKSQTISGAGMAIQGK